LRPLPYRKRRAYDSNGNRISLTYPGNKVVNYGFDALNRIIAFTNWLNGIVTYAYDSRGNLIAATNANSTTASYDYDTADRLVGLTNAAPDASVIAAYAVSLDGIGNHTQATHNQPLFPILANQTNNYAYDFDNRLVTIDGQTVTHNANGDLTGIGTNSYAYDFEDRLVQLLLTNTFTYDGLGNRLARTVNGQARRFVLDRMGALTQILVENDTNNSPVAYYVYGLGLAERISSGGTVATYHFNLQGSTVALTDSSGKVTDSYAYDSFGVLANADGDSLQPFRYLGRYDIVDDSTGLLYARARFFSPQLGRFLTKDTATSKDNDGQSLNRFVYALNNPLRFRDATGFVATEGSFASSSGNSDQNHAYLVLSGESLFDIGEYLFEALHVDVGLESHVDVQYGGLSVGQLRINPGSSIDIAGISGALRFAGIASTLYGLADTGAQEIASRGATFSSFISDVEHAPSAVVYGFQNPDALLTAFTEGVTSATAVDLDLLSFGVLHVHGQDIQNALESNNNPPSTIRPLIMGNPVEPLFMAQPSGPIY
jgi:RHS repeat-associated protein